MKLGLTVNAMPRRGFQGAEADRSELVGSGIQSIEFSGRVSKSATLAGFWSWRNKMPF
jgi:hypothetical protein